MVIECDTCTGSVSAAEIRISEDSDWMCPHCMSLNVWESESEDEGNQVLYRDTQYRVSDKRYRSQEHFMVENPQANFVDLLED